jgi:hypothetical protein
MCMRSHSGGTGSLGVYHGIRNHGHIVWQSHWNGTMLAAKIHQLTRTLCTFDKKTWLFDIFFEEFPILF